MHKRLGAPPGSIGDLDRRFYKLGGASRVVGYGAAWLRSMPTLQLLPPDEVQREKSAILARNTQRDARLAEQIAARKASEAADPMYVSARRLCRPLGLVFDSFTAGSFTNRGSCSTPLAS